MRTSAEQRRQAEQRIRSAADALLRGDIPPDGKCDISTLARQAGVSRAALYRSYPHVKEEFERRLAALRAGGTAPDPRDAQITRLKAQNDELRQKARRPRFGPSRAGAVQGTGDIQARCPARRDRQAPPAGGPRDGRQHPQSHTPLFRRDRPRQPGDTMITDSLATALSAASSGWCHLPRIRETAATRARNLKVTCITPANRQ